MTAAEPDPADDLPPLPADLQDELLAILFGDARLRAVGLSRLSARFGDHAEAVAAHVAWHDNRMARARPPAAAVAPTVVLGTGGPWPRHELRGPGLEPGSTLGDFRIEQHLGQGGMGDVYLAHQVSLNRQVALKMIRGDRATDAAARERFRREARAVANLRHPGICAVFEVGEVGDTPFLAMQYVDGETLAVQLAARRTAPGSQPSTSNDVHAVLRMGARLAEALHAAHEAGVVHRDVKPGNIMIDGRGQPVLLDFGLARELERPASDATLTLSGVAIGTPPYMSPEQIRPRGQIDRRTDVYSLAVTLFECLTLHRPYLAHDPLTLCEQIERDPTPDPRRSNPHLPVDLTAVLAKAMEKDPARRYATALEFAADLERICRSEPVRARRIGAAGRAWRWARRHPLVASLIVVLATGVIVIAYFLDITAQQRNELGATATRLAERNQAYDLLSQVVHLEKARVVLTEIFPVRDVVTARARLDAAVRPLRQAAIDLRTQLLRFRQDAPALTPDEAAADLASHPEFEKWQALQAEVEGFQRAQAVRDADPAERAAALPFDAANASAKELLVYARERVSPRATVQGEEMLAFAAAETLLSRVLQGQQVDNPVGSITTMVFACNAVGLMPEGSALIHLMVNAEDAGVRTGSPATVSAAFIRSVQAELQRIRAGSADELRRLEAKIEQLTSEVSVRRTWHMRHEEDDFLHGRLTALAPEIEAFLDNEIRLAEARLDWAARERQLTIERHGDRWEAARQALRTADDKVASRLYGEGFALTPQNGLVPIGMNPTTGLWEFYHLMSAWDSRTGRDPATLPIPTHDAEGRIDVDSATGIVFVLVPGGLATLGCQSDDPNQPHHDPQCQKREEHPVNQVRLDPYFLARHELTEAQILRLQGRPESLLALPFESPHTFGYVPNVRLPRFEMGNHPTNGETALSFEAALRPCGLTLPTSAQWEYACRAGTASIWPTGDGPASLEGYANLLDLRTSGRQLAQGQKVECAMFDDGFKALAPVGVLRPNRWGFHDMIGNVAEWCADDCAFYSVEKARPGDGWRMMPSASAPWRDVRGGSYKDPPGTARAASRKAVEAKTSSLFTGVRVLRTLER